MATSEDNISDVQLMVEIDKSDLLADLNKLKYCPDFALRDLHLFPEIKGKLRGKWVTDAEEAVAAYEKAVEATPKCEWAKCSLSASSNRTVREDCLIAGPLPGVGDTRRAPARARAGSGCLVTLLTDSLFPLLDLHAFTLLMCFRIIIIELLAKAAIHRRRLRVAYGRESWKLTPGTINGLNEQVKGLASRLYRFEHRFLDLTLLRKRKAPPHTGETYFVNEVQRVVNGRPCAAGSTRIKLCISWHKLLSRSLAATCAR
ncbi:hypothetical protein EVAR_82430_1 [Eumeta japonica]|uniref:Uncharacterized protein n=1 Tax=Eumeta variegata TaxID=151549 RepID=A0A4C1YJL3_EUMVA|nr:hypothetical protein EVAR_82430_1 [Eumeta japonica]